METQRVLAWTERLFPAQKLKKLMAASASAFVLLKEDGAKLSQFVWPVGQETQDCLAVVGFERNGGAFASPGIFEFVGDFELVCVSEAAGEPRDLVVRNGNAGEKHAWDSDRPRSSA
jgi:hypothetical protein